MIKRTLPFLLISTGLILVAASMIYLRFSQATAAPGAVPLPQELSGLQLLEASYGPEAVANVSSLHGKNFPLTSGGVGIYGPSAQATIWVTGVPIKYLATRLVVAMRDKIAEGNSPFLPTREWEHGKRTVYELEGMGQKHYYFQSGRLVVWLAADTELAEETLNHALGYYP